MVSYPRGLHLYDARRGRELLGDERRRLSTSLDHFNARRASLDGRLMPVEWISSGDILPHHRVRNGEGYRCWAPCWEVGHSEDGEPIYQCQNGHAFKGTRKERRRSLRHIDALNEGEASTAPATRSVGLVDSPGASSSNTEGGARAGSNGIDRP